MFTEKDPLVRNLAACCLAIGLTLCSGGTGNGAQFMTYPVNFFIWFNFSVVVSLLIYSRERDMAEAPVAIAGDAPARTRPQLHAAPPHPGQLPAPAHAKA